MEHYLKYCNKPASIQVGKLDADALADGTQRLPLITNAKT